MYSCSMPQDVLKVSILHLCLGGFLLTSQGAIKPLNLHKQADSVNSPHKDINMRNDVICLFSVVSQTLINLHAYLKMSYREKGPNKCFSLNRVSVRFYNQTRQYEQCGQERLAVTNRLSTVFEWIMC